MLKWIFVETMNLAEEDATSIKQEFISTTIASKLIW